MATWELHSLHNPMTLISIDIYNICLVISIDMIDMLRVIRVSVLLFAVLTFSTMAQVDTGTVSGVVKDQTGAIVQNASVKILNAGTGIAVQVSTNNQGLYFAPDLKAGAYQVSVSAAGFQSITKTGVELLVQDRIAVDFTLELGQTATSVSVESQVSALQTETSSVGQVVGTAQIQNMPLNGRNYIQLATLGAGTSPAVNASERNSFTANGVREIQNSYLLDGIDNKNKIVGFDSSAAQSIEPVIDSVREFKVQTSTFSAEFGQAAGAVVNVTTKSGANELHGSAFEYLRNSYLDANPYFQPAGTAKPQFIQNQYGTTAGGHIIKDRTFFFFGWQGTRTNDAAPQLGVVPATAQINGIFGTPLFDPATTVKSGSGYARSPFAGNVVPSSRFDPVSAQLLSLYPAPNLAAKSNFFSNQRETISQDQYVGRLDHRLSDKDSIFGRYSTQANTNVLPALLPLPASNPSIVQPAAHSIVASETHIFTPGLISEVRGGYQETQEIQNIDAPRRFSQYGIAGVPNYPQVLGLPTFAVSGLSTIGTTGPGTLQTAATGSGNLPIDKEGRVIQVDGNLSWVHGRHTVKVGFDFQQITLYANVTLNARPAYTFTGVYTQNPQSRSNTGAAFADFLLGDTTAATESTRSVSNSRQHIYQTYVQDDWQLTNKLTINAGLRYELPLPFYETNNHYANLILEPGLLYGTVLQADNSAAAGYRNSFSSPNYHNFAPRLGLAYKVTPKTVLRAAAGVFYGRDENLGVAGRPTNNPPYFVTTTFTSDQIDPNIILSQGFPATALTPGATSTPTVNSYPKYAPTPYVQQWNFSLQQELGAGFSAQAAYVGSSSHDLYLQNNIDQPLPGPGAIQTRRPLPAYSAINAYNPFVSAHYNSLQAQLERRFNKGLTVLAAYTWAHGLDNDNSSRQVGYDLALEKSSSTFDLRQRFVLSSVYELPFGKDKAYLANSRIGNILAGGWQLSGILSKQTGLPFTPVEAVDASNSGTTERPNRVGSGLLASGQSISNWFDISAFAVPGSYTFGNSGRNILRGPGLTNVDLGLSRVVPIAERFHMEFRAEAFNLFNTPQFGLPNATLGTATAGTITSTVNSQRELQLALRFAF